jgi:hypothetical protein
MSLQSRKNEDVQHPVVGRDAWAQEATLTFSQVKDGDDASLPKQIDSFVSRWHGLPTVAQPGVTFKTRWALESQ